VLYDFRFSVTSKKGKSKKEKIAIDLSTFYSLIFTFYFLLFFASQTDTCRNSSRIPVPLTNSLTDRRLYEQEVCFLAESFVQTPEQGASTRKI